MNRSEAHEAVNEIRKTLDACLYRECRVIVSRTTGRPRYQVGDPGYRLDSAPLDLTGAGWVVGVTGPDALTRKGYLEALHEAGWYAHAGVKPGTRSVPAVVVTGRYPESE